MTRIRAALWSFITCHWSLLLFAHEPITTKVTWSKEVVRILGRRCLGCHSPGNVAMSLATYPEARPWAKSIKEEVLERRMPPWSAAQGFGDFENDRSLTPLEMDLLVAWADGGAPKGEDRDLPAPSSAVATFNSSPDLLLQVPPQPPTPNPQPLTLPTHLKQDRWIRAWEFRPGNRQAIEQAFLRIAPRAELGHWVPPEGAVVLPDGVGELLPAGSRIILEAHYRQAGPDRSALALYFSKDPPAHRLRHLRILCGSTPLDETIQLLAIRPEMPEAGGEMEIVARRPDSSVETLGLFRDYQPSYQATYRYRRPVLLPAGSRLELRATESGCAAYLDYVKK